MGLFSDEDRKRVEAQIARVEERTAGEIVVACVGRSDSHAGRRLLYATLAGAFCASLLHHLLPDADTDWLLLLQIPLIGIWWLALGVPGLLRPLLPAPERARAVQARAARMFTERGIFDTRDHSGVLILLSELEHQVVMLGDRGIHQRVQIEGWNKYVAQIVASIRQGTPGEGVCSVLEDLGGILAEAFPARADDRNELPNQVVDEET